MELAEQHVSLKPSRRPRPTKPRGIPGSWALPWLVAATTSLVVVLFFALSAQTDLAMDQDQHPCAYGECTRPDGTYRVTACPAPCDPTRSDAQVLGTLVLSSKPLALEHGGESRTDRWLNDPERWASYSSGTLNGDGIRWRFLAGNGISVVLSSTGFTGESLVLKRSANGFSGRRSRWSCTHRDENDLVFAAPISSQPANGLVGH
jgi:hypothetical protein